MFRKHQVSNKESELSVNFTFSIRLPFLIRNILVEKVLGLPTLKTDIKTATNTLCEDYECKCIETTSITDDDQRPRWVRLKDGELWHAKSNNDDACDDATTTPATPSS